MKRLPSPAEHPDLCEPVTRRLRLNGQSTSIRLERSFWVILDALAARERLTTPGLVSRLHSARIEQRGDTGNFTSYLRCVCLRQATTLHPSILPLTVE